ncbi:hypothetical protein [Pontibacillus marinus]|uniref:Histone deacetylase n=1 Tax=Pontibacillus marinus BH030004 = DSM 16465 TaxID=1385511 RepID=A0A0A5HKG8_9BACI|nr:hypothetical protein [Pontibacillus marinus]KGX84127.1 hypothetical protein N783_19075 [Pontibacillus marinus BH030004 = DSM 16465]
MSNKVWYASFGSNLFRERFLCYIEGGQPEGSNRREVGSRDATLPVKDAPVSLPFSLYFAGYSDRWDGGAAFIDTHYNENADTWGRMYLITEEQFEDVIRQENGISDLSLDWSALRANGNTLVEKSDYGNLLYAGEREGHPIFTFTHYLPMEEREITVPSKRYLAMLIRGFLEAYTDTPEACVDYLIEKPGVKDHYKYEDLLAFVKEQV